MDVMLCFAVHSGPTTPEDVPSAGEQQWADLCKARAILTVRHEVGLMNGLDHCFSSSGKLHMVLTGQKPFATKTFMASSIYGNIVSWPLLTR